MYRTLRRFAWCTAWLAGLAYIVFFWQQSIGSAPAILVFGRLCGLLGTYFVLWQLVLMGRLPILESAFSFNRLARIHRYNGAIGVGLLAIHPICVLIGHAAANNLGIIAQFIDFQLRWKDVFVATVGFTLLITVIIITIFRSKMRYEIWHAIHLNMYLTIALASSHQFSVGSDLADRPALRAFWYILYIAAFGSIVIFRVALPLYNFRRCAFRVSRTRVEASNVTSIYIVGRHIERFRYAAGQFAIWRFLTPDLWLQAHPFSFSAAPGGKELRITVKAVGDFTHSLQSIKPGAPVLIDGPHGGFTLGQVRRRQLLFIAGGIGITPLRAMLETLSADSPSPVLIYAARTGADLALRSELESLLKTKDGSVHYVLSDEIVKGLHTGLLDKALIAKLVPDVASRDVLLCGPPPMMRQVRIELRSLGVRQNRIHTERFAF